MASPLPRSASRHGAKLLLLCAILPACAGGSLRGDWTGSCDFSDGDYGGPIFMDLVVDRDLGRSLRGTARVTLPEEGIFDVELDGERAGGSAIFRMVLPSSTGQLELLFQGERDADELEGHCELWVPGATAPITGAGELQG